MNPCSTFESSLKTEIGVLKISCCTKGVHSVQIIERLNPGQSPIILNEGVENLEVPECLTVTMQWMKDYFERQVTQESPDICERVLNSKDAFTQQVWRFLKNNPAVIAYSDLVASCGGCAEAVETAVRSNPVPLIIPCHRVVSEERRDFQRFLEGDLGQLTDPERFSDIGRFLGSSLQEGLLQHERNARDELERNAWWAEREAENAEREARDRELEAMYAEREARRAELGAQNEDNEARRVEREARHALRERRNAMRAAQNAEREARRVHFEVQNAEREAENAMREAENAMREAHRAELEAHNAQHEARMMEMHAERLELEALALMLEGEIDAGARRDEQMRQYHQIVGGG